MTPHYAVTWKDPRDGEMVVLRARSISDSQLGLTFVALSDLLWDAPSVLVNPAEERLKRRFEATNVLHLSIHSIASIEEIGQRGLPLEADRSKLLLFPDR